MLNCLVLGLALSAHVGMKYEYNQVHPYAMCETEKTIVGTYYNSLDRWSLVGAYKYRLDEDLTLDVGLATGYDYDIVPMARLRYKNLFVMPSVEGYENEEKRTGVVFGIQFELK
tara:strand:+ start:1736 stop:2077 length:342 start_codon:yes stop_codon:yes gene_type:complete